MDSDTCDLAVRETSRLLLLDPSGHILLLGAVDGYITAPEDGPARGEMFWFTPGGGIEPGESLLDAARRELREETGIIDAEVGPVLWYGEQTLLVRGVPTRCKEHFMIARSSSTDLSRAGWQEDERASLRAMRWWSPAALRATRERVFPSLLPARAGELPAMIERIQGGEQIPMEQISLR